MLCCARGITDLPIGIVFVDEVLHDCATLEHALGAIENSGDTTVGVNFQEPSLHTILLAQFYPIQYHGKTFVLFLLTIGANINSLDLVRQIKLLEGDRSLDAIWCRPRVQSDV